MVIPCRDAERWIGETVASALDQPGVDLEVIVVDDGSRDASRDRVREIGDGRVALLAEPHGGASRARNQGTARARGAYLQYLDADDALLPGALSARLAALEGSGADVAYADWVRWEPDDGGEGGGFRAGAVTARRLGARPDVELFTDAWWPPGALLYRRTLVDRIGPWREDLPVIQDARFLLDAALCGGRFVHVPGIGLRYRVLPGASLSRRDPRAFLDDCYRNALDVHARWARDDTLDGPRRAALLQVYGYLARSYYPHDRARFDALWARLSALDPAYRPAGPRSLRALSGLVGYPRAERVALAWRRLKRLAVR